MRPVDPTFIDPARREPLQIEFSKVTEFSKPSDTNTSASIDETVPSYGSEVMVNTPASANYRATQLTPEVLEPIQYHR